jgi:molybdate transport system substrate-binding protein
MRNVKKLGMWMVMLWTVGFVLGVAALAVQAKEIKVFAAASLTDALREMKPGFEAATGDTLLFNFAGSNVLALQIEEGAPADVFLSADEVQMDRLEKKKRLVPDTRHSVLSNLLVVVVPTDSQLPIASIKDLASSQVKRLVLADPGAGVPAGVYAKAYLKRVHLWGAVIDRVIPAASVRAALAAVEYGAVDAGIVYKTDALISKKVRVAVEVPVSDGPKISYPFAAVSASADPKAAKSFLDYAEGPVGMKIFKKYGFLPASGD